MWAPARMVDAAEEMLSLYARANLDTGPTKPFAMPIVFVAMAKDYMPSGRDFTRAVADRMEVALPGDTKGRDFALRTVAADVRAQVVVAAQDEPTARSIAAQFVLYLDSTPGRRFTARYVFANENLDWPVVIESPDAQAINVPTDARNLTMLAIDVTLRATVPLLAGPNSAQANDGKGTPMPVDLTTADPAVIAQAKLDPAGFPLVNAIFGTAHDAEHRGAADDVIGAWQVGE
jgi:hypothetical protein